ncbi:MAG: MGMT family protein [Acidimicrobiales bacterium]|jgi:methylated-DNA-protein-cysteine methyltransferase-like protein
MHDAPASPAAGSTAFAPAVRRVIQALQAGDVVTYGEVAREAGFTGAARAVGTLLARGGSDLPWWRIVTSTGRLVPGHEVEHARRLRDEGVDIAGEPPRVRRARRHAGDGGLRPAVRRPRGEVST